MSRSSKEQNIVSTKASSIGVPDSAAWVDVERGLVDRRIFTDPQIYAWELERIFARTWHFICHESQLPETGSFFLNTIGEDQVIAVRDAKGIVRVLLNTCPHRGNTVCRAEQGKARSFLCSYHGWNFGLDGRLVGVPGLDEYYRGELDRDRWGLSQAAQVTSYKGFVFATLAADAPPLEEFLGWVGRLALDAIAELGDIEVVDGIQKNRIQCNWKLAVDNLFDWYHPKVSHGSAIRAGALHEKELFPQQQMVLLGEYGHAIGGPGLSTEKYAELKERHLAAQSDSPFAWRYSDEAEQLLGPLGVRSRGHPNIFPNLWIALGGQQLCLRIPKGPTTTELWWFTLVPKSMTAEERREAIWFASHMFGPAGLLEQDDGENWSHGTRNMRFLATQDRPLNFAMGLGKDEAIADPPSGQRAFETVVNEHAQRWLYRSWQEWMDARDWADLIANHSPSPDVA